jgi:hypothetical protein
MARRLLSSVVTVLTTLSLMAAALFAVGVWRKSQDTKWCQNAVIGGTVSADPELTTPDLVAQQRSACAQQRERQRMMLGAFWRKDGGARALCGFDLARVQLHVDPPEERRAITARYGIDDPSFTGGGLDEQNRFIRACAAKRVHKAG